MGKMGRTWSCLGYDGTLIGLILMLKDMNDASTIGPKMAVALVTTLYGSLIANWLCNPTASKLSVNNNNEMMMKEITVEGILSIQAGENPRVIEEKLKSSCHLQRERKLRRAVSEVRNSGEKKGRSTQRLTCMDEYLRGPYESPALFLRNAFLHVQCE